MKSYKKKKIVGGRGGNKHYVYYRKSDRKSYGSAILRQRPVALLVGWIGGKMVCLEDNKNQWEFFFMHQMKEAEQLTLFTILMQAYGILHCDVILILALPGSFRMKFWC
jgi:hypothetical protein